MNCRTCLVGCRSGWTVFQSEALRCAYYATLRIYGKLKTSESPTVQTIIGENEVATTSLQRCDDDHLHPLQLAVAKLVKSSKDAKEAAFDRRPVHDNNVRLYDIWTVDFISKDSYQIFKGIDVEGLIFGTTKWEHPREVGKAGWTTESRRAAWKALKDMDVLSACFAKLREPGRSMGRHH